MSTLDPSATAVPSKEEEELIKLQELIKQQGTDFSDAKRRLSENELRGAGYRAVEQTEQERKAGVTPPGYEGIRDLQTGELLEGFKSDAYGGEALQRLKGEAFSDPNESVWTKMQMAQQGMAEEDARDRTAASGAQALAQAQQQLMRQGGLGSGARERMASEAAKNLARSQQDVARRGMADRLGIGSQAIDRQANLLGRFADSETRANEANIGRRAEDVKRSGIFDLERYRQNMAAYGAKESADAQRSASGGGGKK